MNCFVSQSLRLSCLADQVKRLIGRAVMAGRLHRLGRHRLWNRIRLRRLPGRDMPRGALPGRVCVIIGNEGQGITRRTLDSCTRCGRMQRSSAARGNAGRSTAIFCPSAAVPAHKRETNSSVKNSFARISLSPFQNLILLL